MKEADRVLDHEFTFVGCAPKRMGRAILWDEDPFDYEQWAIALNRHTHWISLGKAYAKTGDERYAREFVEQLTGWVHSMPVRIGERYLEGLADEAGRGDGPGSGKAGGRGGGAGVAGGGGRPMIQYQREFVGTREVEEGGKENFLDFSIRR